jgi:hypothetical protein
MCFHTEALVDCEINFSWASPAPAYVWCLPRLKVCMWVCASSSELPSLARPQFMGGRWRLGRHGYADSFLVHMHWYIVAWTISSLPPLSRFQFPYLAARCEVFDPSGILVSSPENRRSGNTGCLDWYSRMIPGAVMLGFGKSCIKCQRFTIQWACVDLLRSDW